MSEAALETKALSMSFGALRVANDIDFRLEEGARHALIAETTSFVGLDVLDPINRSGEILIMLILGGVGRLYGAFIGVPLYMIMKDQFAEIDPVYWYFWIGLILVLVVVFARGGALGLGERLLHRLRARKE